jgi:NAD-dependent deacetylase
MESQEKYWNKLDRKENSWVFFTGAGCSTGSGLPTFRGEGGIWDEINAEEVANRNAWYCGRYSDCKERRQKVLDFFNPIRRKILELAPNEAHRKIAAFERLFDSVTVITQNGDDYHERAGSKNVIYLHGEALKNCSTNNPNVPIDIDKNLPDIHIGDKANDGSQIRPYVIFFNEDLDKTIFKKAEVATKEADFFVVVGSSLKVFPAANLLAMTKKSCQIIVIDKEKVELPESIPSGRKVRFIMADAAEGLSQLYSEVYLQIKKEISKE